MIRFLKNIKAEWVKYSKYEIKESSDGTRYVIPAPGAKLEIIDPLDNAEDMIIEALNIGRMLMREKKAESEAVLLKNTA